MCVETTAAGSPGEWRGNAKSRRAGFTLVELLVVIGIIALLISIMLPSLNAARRQATRIACAANIRSIGQSYQLYAAEYKGNYPPVQMWHWPIGNWGNPWWDDPDANHMPPIPDGAGLLVTNGYVKDPRIYYCPGQDDISWVDWQDQEKNWLKVAQGDYTGLSAAHNGYHHYANYYSQWGDPNYPTNKGMYGVPAPVATGADDRGDKVLATDMMLRRTNYDWGINMNGHLLPDRSPKGRKRTSDPDPTRLVEFEGGNVLYNDGHAEWKNVSETKLRWQLVPGWFEAYW